MTVEPPSDSSALWFILWIFEFFKVDPTTVIPILEPKISEFSIIEPSVRLTIQSLDLWDLFIILAYFIDDFVSPLEPKLIPAPEPELLFLPQFVPVNVTESVAVPSTLRTPFVFTSI